MRKAMHALVMKTYKADFPASNKIAIREDIDKEQIKNDLLREKLLLHTAKLSAHIYSISGKFYVELEDKMPVI